MDHGHVKMNITAGLVTFIGILFLSGPFLFYYWLHGNDDERYAGIISGPFPFSHLGSGPVQLWLSVALFGAGILITLLGVSMYRESKTTTSKQRL